MELTVAPVTRLAGRIRVSGDKSISHRAALIGAIAEGDTTIRGFLRAEDCLRTLACLRTLGVAIEDQGTQIVVHGSGPRLTVPAGVLDAGNSGTTMRLLAGILATQPFTAEITGDDSLRARPMDRIVEPLTQMGARVQALGQGRCPPLRITGGRLRGISYTLPVASAQVKSAVLLAGLMAEGQTTVTEPVRTRDHTERMLTWFGARMFQDGTAVTIVPGRLQGREVVIPGDPSSAAFFLTAAAARAGSEVTVEGIGLNPTRTGFLEVLKAMGADVDMRYQQDLCGEPVGAVTVRGRGLRGVRIGGAMIPGVIDELPVLCVAAAVAEGTTEITDASELRVKESDRIGMVARGLHAVGIQVQERADGMTIHGGTLRGGRVDSAGDHRVAMAFAVAGLLARDPVTVAGAESIAASFPQFTEALRELTGTRERGNMGTRT